MRDRAPHPPAAAGIRLSILSLACLQAVLACAPTHQHDAAAAAPSRADTLRAVHLLQRATYGARPQDVEAVLRMGREAWLDRQLEPDGIDDRAVVARLGRLRTADLSVDELHRTYPPRGFLRDSLQAGGSLTAKARRELARRHPRHILNDLIAAKLERAVHSERQLQEVMTDFWFNHFNVFFHKGRVRWLTADYERSAIRPHVFGTFEELLTATASHPAMLFYLDNWRSRKPGAANGAGLNENYARELLELHTLGVNGGYTQEDVIEVARAFTGWTMTGPRRNAGAGRRAGDGGEAADTSSSGSRRGMRFVFRAAMHDRGGKVLLGQPLSPGRGREDGLDVLRMLAHHPSTARHIATKLVRHFVADEPPPALVDELSAVFLDTGGDLRAVTRALFASDAFYAAEHRGAKVKRPFELVASALRVTGAEIEKSPRGAVRVLRRFQDLPYMERAPTGYPAANDSWVNSAAVLTRMNFAVALASQRLKGISAPGPELRERAAGAASDADLVATLAGFILPGGARPELVAAVTEELESHSRATSDREALAARALGLILGSPEFQRR